MSDVREVNNLTRNFNIVKKREIITYLSYFLSEL